MLSLDRMNEHSFSMIDLLLDVEPLSQVVFVHDYIQLAFQDTYFSLYNQVTVIRHDNLLTRNDLGFCDELPEVNLPFQITHLCLTKYPTSLASQAGRCANRRSAG